MCGFFIFLFWKNIAGAVVLFAKLCGGHLFSWFLRLRISMNGFLQKIFLRNAMVVVNGLTFEDLILFVVFFFKSFGEYVGASTTQMTVRELIRSVVLM